jgi:DNA-binding transcriptional MerR regulator
MAAQKRHGAENWYPTATAASLSGLTPHMVNYLCRVGLVEPSCEGPRGHGSRRRYSFGDLVALRLVARLSKSGVSFLRLREGLDRLRKLNPEIRLQSLPGNHFVTDGFDIILCEPTEPLERAVDGQLGFAFIVQLQSIRDEVSEAIQKLKTATGGEG